MSSSVHVVIASHLQLFRESLAVALQTSNDHFITTVASDLQEVFESLQDRKADIALVARDLLGDNCLPTLAAFSQDLPETSVLVLGTDDSEDSITSFLEAGAKGYITDDASFDDLKLAFARVLRGEVVCSPRAARFMFRRLARLGSKHARLQEIKSVTLTFRELDILRLIARGYTNEQVGQRLSISMHTVKNHVHNILDKLEVETRLQAVHLAYEKKWLRINSPETQGSS